jgi:hypothetical protein
MQDKLKTHDNSRHFPRCHTRTGTRTLQGKSRHSTSRHSTSGWRQTLGGGGCTCLSVTVVHLVLHRGKGGDSSWGTFFLRRPHPFKFWDRPSTWYLCGTIFSAVFEDGLPDGKNECESCCCCRINTLATGHSFHSFWCVDPVSVRLHVFFSFFLVSAIFAFFFINRVWISVHFMTMLMYHKVRLNSSEHPCEKGTKVKVSLKGYRQNWQGSSPGQEKVNQLINTNFNKWNFHGWLKHVQKSIIQLYLQKVTL